IESFGLVRSLVAAGPRPNTRMCSLSACRRRGLFAHSMPHSCLSFLSVFPGQEFQQLPYADLYVHCTGCVEVIALACYHGVDFTVSVSDQSRFTVGLFVFINNLHCFLDIIIPEASLLLTSSGQRSQAPRRKVAVIDQNVGSANDSIESDSSDFY